MRLLLTIALSLLLTTASMTHEQANKAECKKINQKIRHIQSRMRSGYTRAEGERLEALLRKLRQQRKSKCRS
jgi:hypothetical protein